MNQILFPAKIKSVDKPKFEIYAKSDPKINCVHKLITLVKFNN